MTEQELRDLEVQYYHLWEEDLKKNHVQFMLQKVEYEADELAKSLANVDILTPEGQNRTLKIQGSIEGMRVAITTLKESHYVNTQSKSSAIP